MLFYITEQLNFTFLPCFSIGFMFPDFSVLGFRVPWFFFLFHALNLLSRAFHMFEVDIPSMTFCVAVQLNLHFLLSNYLVCRPACYYITVILIIIDNAVGTIVPYIVRCSPHEYLLLLESGHTYCAPLFQSLKLNWSKPTMKPFIAGTMDLISLYFCLWLLFGWYTCYRRL